MKKASVLFMMLISFYAASAQLPQPPSGDNQQSSVSQMIGLVKVTINYSSPDVHGPNGEDRKGKIWGTNVAHYGLIDQGFGTSKAAPWRAGANENTLITFSHDVTIAGKQVKAGTYSLFLHVKEQGPWTWIINKDTNAWGSYYYDPAKDVVQVEANPQEAEYTEWLTYSFDDRRRHTATAYLQWENKRIGFKIDVPNTNELYVDAMADVMRGTTTGFTHEAYLRAAEFCVVNNVRLEQALIWANHAVTDPFVGREDFASLITKAQVLTALKRDAEAEVIMDKAIRIPGTSVQAVHQYGRSLLNAGKTDKALEVFKFNAKNHPEDKFTVNVGLARAYTATGDKKNAIKYWETAIKNIPENQKQNLSFYEGELKKLKG